MTDCYSEDLKRFLDRPGSDTGAGWAEVMLLWPALMIPWSDERAQNAMENIWRNLEPSFNLERDHGSYEVLALLTLAKVWQDDPEKLAKVREALLWEATVPTNELGHFGEIWLKSHGEVVPGQSQPHVWHHALFYLAALEAFGSR